MARPKVVIQEGPDWVRVYLNEVEVLDEPAFTGELLQEFLKGLGFDCVLQRGMFHEQPEDADDDRFDFECVTEER